MEPNQDTQLAVLPTAALARNCSSAVWNSLSEIYDCPSPETLGLVLDYCTARKMDPLKKPVHIVPVWSKRRGRMVDTLWPSILEVRTTAMRTGLYAGMDEAKLGPMQKLNLGTVKDFEFPEWIQITVYRLVAGQRCAFAGQKVYFLEAYAAKGKGDITPNEMWGRRTWGQLEKCAEAAALRRAFPEETGMTADEMYGREPDDGMLNVTPGGAAAAADPSAPALGPVGNVRAKMPGKRKGAAALEAAEPITVTPDLTPPTTELKVEPEPAPPPETPVTVPTPATEIPAAVAPPAAAAPASAPVSTAEPEPEKKPSRATKAAVAKPEWPKTIIALIEEVKDAPTKNNPKFPTVKVARLSGGKYTLAGEVRDVRDLGRIVFDPEKPELLTFAVPGDELIELVIEEQPSASNPEQKVRIIVKACVAEVAM